FSGRLLNDAHGGLFRYGAKALPLRFGKQLVQQGGSPDPNRGRVHCSGLSVIHLRRSTSLRGARREPDPRCACLSRCAAPGTGANGLADLLLGIPNSSGQDFLTGLYPTRYWDLAEFAQDDFHVLPNLTLNIGLRYEVTSPANGRVGNFDLDRAVVVNSYGPN